MVMDYLAERFIYDNLPYRSFKCAESNKIRMHRHDFWEIVYVYEGIGENHTENTSSIITEGNLLLISPGAAHTIISNSNANCPRVRICNCLFTIDFFDKALNDYFKINELKNFRLYSILKNRDVFCVQLNDNEIKTICGYIYDINRECCIKDIRIDELIKNSIVNLLIEATRIYETPERNLNSDTKENSLAAILEQYMKANLNSKITLASLSEQVHLAPAYLSRYFKEHTGETVSEYLFRIRIERAAELLRTTSYSITEISALCGYSSLGNFQRYFKKLVGISPSEYRKNLVKLN